MFLAAMLDAGLPLEVLEDVFQKIHLPEYKSFSFQKVMKGAIVSGSIDFDLIPEDHHHRTFSSIRDLINQSDLTAGIKEKAVRIFQKIAEAEAEVHQTTIDNVHFHEVGAVDSILDIVGAAAALDYFEIDKFYSSPLPLGTGEVMTQHGKLPIPAPATAAMIRDMNAKIRPSSVARELVTPTGAGILAAFAKFEQPSMTMFASGVGAGKADLEHPNILRVFIGETEEQAEDCVVLETNLDDMTSEALGAALQRMLEAGALDAWFTPIQMKKNRPAVKFSVLAALSEEKKIADLILRHTSTLGVRSFVVQRHMADRKMITLDTDYGPVRAKAKLLKGETISAHPEYDDCERISRETGLPFLEVFHHISKAIR